MNCLHCNLETQNPKFCSMSCAAKHNNKKYPKRIRSIIYCQNCGLEKPNSVHKESKYCRVCRPNYGQDLTLAQAIYKKHGAPNAYTLIRVRARQIAKSINLVKCSKCSYDKHIEIAHIKAISDFSQDTLISEINSLDNLLALCPNCHWEFDNLPREEIINFQI
jgi:5-methylcytosine-specific restriction endonuclease McrA